MDNHGAQGDPDGMQFYDASAAGMEGSVHDDSPSLTDLVARGATNELRATLSDLRELLDRADERDRDEPLPEDLEERMARIAGASDAPLEFVSMARRVADGRLSWREVWLDPQREAGGLRLVAAIADDLRATVTAPQIDYEE